jgi:peptidoglycan/LPS O-acetylase OafA/YrhL
MGASHRIEALDGLRAVAVMGVVLYHYFVRFAATGDSPALYPYGDICAEFPIAKYGFMGVQLFFVVSGFVIAMTLERCRTMSEFYLRRFARIWPPLLVCSIITMAVLQVIDSDFAAQRRTTMLDFAPSLTMTSPRLWQWLSHDIKYIDAAYWSLFVEARFYIYAAIIYRWSAHGKFLRNYIIFAAVGVILAIICRALLQNEKWYLVVDGLFYPEHTLWFAAGILFYEMWHGDLRRVKALGLLALGFVPLVYMLSTIHPDSSIVVLGTISLTILFLFGSFVIRPELLAPLRSRPVLWLGTTSYSVYLLHQNVGLGFISLIPRQLPLWLQLVLVAIIFCAVLLVARIVYVFVEQRGKALVLRNLLRGTAPTSRRSPV